MTQPPIQVPPPTPTEPARWLYAVSGQSYGPVTTGWMRSMLEARRMSPETPVWREGMDEWVPARSVGELMGGLKLPREALMSPPQRRRAARVRNAKINSVVMCGLLTGFLADAGRYVQLWLDGLSPRYLWWESPLIVGQLFALIYVPLRWRTIRRLPQGFHVAGMIGGIGLIVSFLITVTYVVFLFSTGENPFRSPRRRRRRSPRRTRVEVGDRLARPQRPGVEAHRVQRAPASQRRTRALRSPGNAAPGGLARPSAGHLSTVRPCGPSRTSPPRSPSASCPGAGAWGRRRIPRRAS